MKNLGDVMKQVQDMQSRMQDMEAALALASVTGQSGGGLVKVTMSGKSVVTGIVIDPSLMNADEREILEDLLVAAVNDARLKQAQLMTERMKDITGGLPLPPGLKLPF